MANSDPARHPVKQARLGILVETRQEIFAKPCRLCVGVLQDQFTDDGGLFPDVSRLEQLSRQMRGRAASGR